VGTRRRAQLAGSTTLPAGQKRRLDVGSGLARRPRPPLPRTSPHGLRPLLPSATRPWRVREEPSPPWARRFVGATTHYMARGPETSPTGGPSSSGGGSHPLPLRGTALVGTELEQSRKSRFLYFPTGRQALLSSFGADNRLAPGYVIITKSRSGCCHDLNGWSLDRGRSELATWRSPKPALEAFTCVDGPAGRCEGGEREEETEEDNKEGRKKAKSRKSQKVSERKR